MNEQVEHAGFSREDTEATKDLLARHDAGETDKRDEIDLAWRLNAFLQLSNSGVTVPNAIRGALDRLVR
jgi:hypothetical protein